MKRNIWAIVFVCTFGAGLLFAQGPKRFSETPAEFEAKLGFKTGNVTLSGGIATVRVPKNMRFIGE